MREEIKMIVLVTGANGYIGQGVVHQLLEDNIEVIAIDFSMDNVDERAVRYQTDLFESADPLNEFTYNGKKADKVLHLAWRNGFIHNSDNHIEDIPFHYSLLKKFIDAGIKGVAVMGTMHEVGFWEGCIKEDTPTNPQSLYGVSKDALRKSIRLLTDEKNVKFQWMRGFYIVGNTEFGSSVFSKITMAEKRGDKVFPFTSGQNQWDFIDYDELCKQVAAVVEQDDINGIINVCSGRPEKLADRVERFIKDNQYQIKLAYGTFPDRPYDSKAVWGDDTKIRCILERE